jgi:hypothetical protein
MRSSIVVLAMLTLAALPAGARPSRAAAVPASAAPAEGKPPRVQRLSFDDDVVNARRDLGDGDVLTEPRKPKFPSLVRPRLDFIPELVKSADTF